MKGKWTLLTAAFLGAVIGWTVGYLRLPFPEVKHSFWVGVLACLASVLLFAILIGIWKRNARLQQNGSVGNAPSKGKLRSSLWLLLTGLVVIGGIGISLLLQRQNDLIESQSQRLDQAIADRMDMLEGLRIGKLVPLMGDVLAAAEQEAKENEAGALSEGMVGRVAALSQSLKPYRGYAGDSLSDQALSPERGQLLLNLSLMGMDSASFAGIKAAGSFAGADLGGADLHGADLSGADLSGANLKDADLRGANLKAVNFWKANLWGVSMDSADLSGADLRRGDLAWARMNGAVLKGTKLSGATLDNAKMRGADLRNCFFRWAQAKGVILTDAKFKGGDLFATDFEKANLSGADLTETDLRHSKFKDAKLAKVQLNRAVVQEETWVQKVWEWEATGAKEIQAGYKVVEDTSGRIKGSKYCLVPTGL